MKEKDSFWITFGLLGALGIQLSISVVAGWLIGNYFDHRWGTDPWLALIGLILGFAGGLYNLIRVIRWRQKKQGKT